MIASLRTSDLNELVRLAKKVNDRWKLTQSAIRVDAGQLSLDFKKSELNESDLYGSISVPLFEQGGVGSFECNFSTLSRLNFQGGMVHLTDRGNRVLLRSLDRSVSLDTEFKTVEKALASNIYEQVVLDSKFNLPAFNALFQALNFHQYEDDDDDDRRLRITLKNNVLVGSTNNECALGRICLPHQSKNNSEHESSLTTIKWLLTVLYRDFFLGTNHSWVRVKQLGHPTLDISVKTNPDLTKLVDPTVEFKALESQPPLYEFIIQSDEFLKELRHAAEFSNETGSRIIIKINLKKTCFLFSENNGDIFKSSRIKLAYASSSFQFTMRLDLFFDLVSRTSGRVHIVIYDQGLIIRDSNKAYIAPIASVQPLEQKK